MQFNPWQKFLILQSRFYTISNFHLVHTFKMYFYSCKQYSKDRNAMQLYCYSLKTQSSRPLSRCLRSQWLFTMIFITTITSYGNVHHRCQYWKGPVRPSLPSHFGHVKPYRQLHLMTSNYGRCMCLVEIKCISGMAWNGFLYSQPKGVQRIILWMSAG